MNKTIIDYQGKLKIKYLIGGKEVTYKAHNEGLAALFKYICKLLSGNTETVLQDRPAYVTLMAVGGSSNTEKIPCLYNNLSISNPEFLYDNELGQWVTRFTVVLSYNMLDMSTIKAYANNNDYKFYLYLLSQSREEFARLEYDNSTQGLPLSSIVPGTQAIIEWTMIVKNSATSTEE